MLALIKSIPVGLIVLKELLLISRELWKMIRDLHEKSQRAAVAKDLRVALRVSRETHDNTKLVEIFGGITEKIKKPDEQKS